MTGTEFRAARIVNAAGAWADNIAALAGLAPIGIQPLRRTVVQLRVDPPALADLPLVLDINGGFYFKPDAGRLWLSPHDEIPDTPRDVAPEDLDVAIAIDRFEQATGWRNCGIGAAMGGPEEFCPGSSAGLMAPIRQTVRSSGLLDKAEFGIQTAPAGGAVGRRSWQQGWGRMR